MQGQEQVPTWQMSTCPCPPVPVSVHLSLSLSTWPCPCPLGAGPSVSEDIKDWPTAAELWSRHRQQARLCWVTADFYVASVYAAHTAIAAKLAAAVAAAT